MNLGYFSFHPQDSENHVFLSASSVGISIASGLVPNIGTTPKVGAVEGRGAFVPVPVPVDMKAVIRCNCETS